MIFQVLTDLLPLPLLIWMAAADWRHRQIPNVPVILLIVCSLILTPIHTIPLSERILGFIFPVLPLFFLAIRYPEHMKGGDIKYLAALGAYAGLYRMTAILVIGTVTALPWAQARKVRSIPLAFFMGIGYGIHVILVYIYHYSKGGHIF